MFRKKYDKTKKLAFELKKGDKILDKGRLVTFETIESIKPVVKGVANHLVMAFYPIMGGLGYKSYKWNDSVETVKERKNRWKTWIINLLAKKLRLKVKVE